MALLPVGIAHAEGNSGVQKLREMVRNVTVQLRTAEADKIALQATNADLTDQNTKLTDQVKTLTKHAAADKDASDKTIADLNTKLTAQEAMVTKLKAALLEMTTNRDALALTAKALDGDKVKLTGDVTTLQQVVAEQRTRNDALFKLGKEILDRYEKFGLGDALTAREPFIGKTRVKFENLVQDYSDRLVDQKVTPVKQ